MADPIVKKITQLTEATSIAADDLIVIVDVSESVAANKTKKAIARLIKLYNSSQITDGIVTDSKIASSAVTDTKIASNAVTTTKIADNAVTNSKIADNAISPAKTSFMPISSVDNTVPRFDSTGGKLQTSGVVIGDDNRLSLTTSGTYAMIIKGKDTSVSSYTILCRNSEDSNTFYVCNDGTVVAPRFQGDIVKLGAVGTNAIADGAVTAGKLASGAVETVKIKDANVTQAKMAANSVDSPQIIAGAVDAVHLSDQTIARNLIYIQLFGVGELVVTTTAKAYFWVPSHLAGKKVKKVGMGLVTAGSSNTTVQLGSSGAYGSISGNGYAESADLNISLPAVGTKIPINVTAGGGSPKGLDFWFVVG